MAINNLYSCFSITPAPSEQNEWSLFSTGVGWPLAGDQSLIQTRAHTNIPRSGDTGLPMNWEAFIRTWRASMNMRFADGPLLDWAQATSAELFFNEKPYATAPLLDLLAAPQAVFDDVPSREFFEARYDPRKTEHPAFRPMWIRENICYGVTITSPQKAIDGVKKWLADHSVERLLCWVHLDGVVLSARRDP